MSIEVMSLAWYVGDLTPAQKAVLVALADHANEDGRHAYPGVERLTYKTSYAERTVRRALSDLRSMGLIRVVRAAKHHRSTEYEIDLSEMQARQNRPARDAPQEESDLPENTGDLPESPNRPARDAPKPSYNRQLEPSGEGAPGRRLEKLVKRGAIPPPQTESEQGILDHPAIESYVLTTERWPGYDVTAELIMERVGENPNTDALTKAWQFWVASGNKRSNALGVLDWYDNICTDPDWSPGDRFSTSNNGSGDPRRAMWENWIQPYHKKQKAFDALPNEAKQIVRQLGGDEVQSMSTKKLRIRYYTGEIT